MEGQGVSDTVRVAVASLVKLINLLGAELLVGKHRDDIDEFEQSVRAKLFASAPGATPEETAAGVALAHSLIEPVLASLRERVRQLEDASTPTFAAPSSTNRRLN